MSKSKLERFTLYYEGDTLREIKKSLKERTHV